MLQKILYLLFLFPVAAQSQFYYKDQVSLQQTTELQQQYKAQKIRKVILNSFSPAGEPTPDFVCFQEVSPTYNIIKTYTQSAASMQSVLVSQFNPKMQLIRSSDSSNSSLSVTTYTYNEKGQLTELTVTTQSYAYKQSETEKHNWMYDAEGRIQQMFRIRNNDTLSVKFKCDENNQPIEEEWFNRNGVSTALYYYYYDNKRLTDIVKFNDRAKKLLPESVFEYNPSGQLQQMLTVQPGSSNYLVWRYSYNQQGLKEKESCYDKQKRLLGYVTYRYQ